MTAGTSAPHQRVHQRLPASRSGLLGSGNFAFAKRQLATRLTEKIAACHPPVRCAQILRSRLFIDALVTMNTQEAKIVLEAALLTAERPLPLTELRRLFADELNADTLR